MADDDWRCLERREQRSGKPPARSDGWLARPAKQPNQGGGDQRAGDGSRAFSARRTAWRPMAASGLRLRWRGRDARFPGPAGPSASISCCWVGQPCGRRRQRSSLVANSRGATPHGRARPRPRQKTVGRAQLRLTCLTVYHRRPLCCGHRAVVQRLRQPALSTAISCRRRCGRSGRSVRGIQQRRSAPSRSAARTKGRWAFCRVRRAMHQK